MYFNEADEPKKQMFIGLDLGQAKDFTALCIINRTEGPLDDHRFDCIHLQRWPLRTSYPAIVADVVSMIGRLPYEIEQPVLAIDATGVGAPVVDLFKKETIRATLMPIQIVGGSNVSREFGMTRVPKRDLVSTVQVALQNRRLKVASGLNEAGTLLKELQNFQVKITDAANDTYGAWREGTHDDLVLAAALALWTASRPIFRVTGEERAMFQGLADRRW